MPDYVFQPYPAWRYHATLPATIVADEAADKALGKGWFDSPTKVTAPPVATQVPAPPPPPAATQLPAEEPPGLEVPEPEPEPESEPEAPRRRRATQK